MTRKTNELSIPHDRGEITIRLTLGTDAERRIVERYYNRSGKPWSEMLLGDMRTILDGDDRAREAAYDMVVGFIGQADAEMAAVLGALRSFVLMRPGEGAVARLIESFPYILTGQRRE